MAEMYIDFSSLTAKGSKLLSGKENGRAAYTFFNLSAADENTRLIIKGDDDLVISNSYFLGMFEKIFRIFKTKDELLQHIDFNSLRPTNRDELMRGINRGFQKNSYL